MTQRLVSTAVAFVLVASFAEAQSAGTISGTVQDASGAALPGATVTATSPALAVTQSAATNSEGFFQLLELPPGTYSVAVELTGFKRVEKSNVILPTRSLSFREQAGVHRNELALRGLLRDERGKPVDNRYLFTRSIEMRLPEARFADLRSRDNVEIPADAPAPKPGRCQLTVVLRHSGGRIASATADVVVP